mmetsp:Transcript_14670/g.26507  ORF Transcript_14670/g.26507 Transcript_14670/m.26507 type:complete len:213 (-) Transcript_14670:1498-2136(-)
MRKMGRKTRIRWSKRQQRLLWRSAIILIGLFFIANITKLHILFSNSANDSFRKMHFRFEREPANAKGEYLSEIPNNPNENVSESWNPTWHPNWHRPPNPSVAKRARRISSRARRSTTITERQSPRQRQPTDDAMPICTTTSLARPPPAIIIMDDSFSTIRYRGINFYAVGKYCWVRIRWAITMWKNVATEDDVRYTRTATATTTTTTSLLLM